MKTIYGRQIMRVFIGIPLPDYYQQMLEKIRDEWNNRLTSRLTWTKPGNWHITLKFLGDVDNDQVVKLKNYLSGISFKNFALHAHKSGFFGSRGQYRIFWLGVYGEVQKLILLAENLDKGLVDLGFEPEKRPFKAHLTLARIKNFDKSDPWKDLSYWVDGLDWPAFNAERVNLWQSILSPRGPTYKVLLSRELHD